MPAARRDTAVSGAGGNGRALQARGQRTRQRLLDAAADVFDRTGYHAARVDDVVAAAKSSHGTFYLYFTSKEDLFEQLVGDVAAELHGLIGELAPVTNSARGREALRAWLARVRETYARHGRVIRAWTEAELSGDPVGRQGDDVLTGLALALTRRMRLPKRSGLDPTIATLALMMMVERLNYYAASGQVDLDDEDELLDTLTDVVMATAFG
ncbi:MAG TPA: TetR/AcrR family transcriptional regulator [Acidimicrobiales bacterium]|nr:TetR/AcrR family transcriptional regulator [Acidimicrobiales bacterium]